MTAADPDLLEAAPRLLHRRMTEEQFVAWATRSRRRAEWVDGEVELMNAVEVGHVDWVFFLVRLLGGFVIPRRLGKVLGEPYQVRLPRRRRQPDLFVVPTAKRHLVRRLEFDGTPDLIVEVVSPESQTRDRHHKFAEYQAAGVPEYWMPDPTLRTFEAYSLGRNGRYTRLPEQDGRVYSTVLTGVFFRPDWLRLFEPPDVESLLLDMSAERARLLSSPPPPASDKTP